MPAAERTCSVCGGEFYGRKDAKYCSTACRQKSYRRRSGQAKFAKFSESRAPVPAGDDWMRDRFDSGYLPMAHRPAAGDGQAKHRAAAQSDGVETLRDYVQGITCIGRRPCDDAALVTGQDLSTPLGNTLPAQLDPATAAALAADLKAALPRLIELASLLERRAQMIPLPMKVPFGQARD